MSRSRRNDEAPSRLFGSRRSIALVWAAITAVTAATASGGLPAAHADACTDNGLQPRVIMTDHLSVTAETQYCLDGEWTPVSRMQFSRGNTLRITETVHDPRDDRFRFANAADFFDLKSYDAYAVVQEAQKLVTSGIDLFEKDHLEQAMAMAIIRNQGLVNRMNLHSNDGCRVRSSRVVDTKAYGPGWLPPQSILAADEPHTIDFAFGPHVSREYKVAVLNAVEQYAAAVAAQDSLMQYPTRLVPHDPASDRVPTILFEQVDRIDDEDSSGQSQMTHVTTSAKGTHWGGGVVTMDKAFSPSTVGHEIGHVLGLDHIAGRIESTMFDGYPKGTAGNPWTVYSDPGDVESVAFDPCMFRPATGQ
jgi:hypothetical protein